MLQHTTKTGEWPLTIVMQWEVEAEEREVTHQMALLPARANLVGACKHLVRVSRLHRSSLIVL